jgi:hypothetical protein
MIRRHFSNLQEGHSSDLQQHVLRFLQGARKQFELLGTHDKKLVVLGPEAGQVGAAATYVHHTLMPAKAWHGVRQVLC